MGSNAVFPLVLILGNLERTVKLKEIASKVLLTIIFFNDSKPNTH